MEELSAPFMVFDVESVGLHGEGFAVGWVVVDRTGKEIESGYEACPMTVAKGGSERDRQWVSENVIPGLSGYTQNTPNQVRDGFWTAWLKWKEAGTHLFAECGWPVEARFLAACVDDSPEVRHWSGPFPLQEIASFQDAARVSKRDHPRLANELPRHNPLADARQSARLLILSLDLLHAKHG